MAEHTGCNQVGFRVVVVVVINMMCLVLLASKAAKLTRMIVPLQHRYAGILVNEVRTRRGGLVTTKSTALNR